MDRVISADSHVQEPPEIFERLPKSLRHITFTDDPIALRTLEFTGADCLLRGSDYPHDEGSFPHSQEVITRTFEGLSDEDRQEIVWGNAARIYGFDA